MSFGKPYKQLVNRVYEFEVHLMINGKLNKSLQKIRFFADYYNTAEQKLKEHFDNIENVLLIEYYFIQDYNVWL